MECKHAEKKEVKELLRINEMNISKEEKQEKRKNVLTLLRNKGNHRHNIKVKNSGEGLIILARAPSGDGPFYLDTYKPCPSCFAWVMNLAKHRTQTNRCVGADTKINKREAECLATVLEEVPLTSCASKELMEEVFSKFASNDKISEIITNDTLLIKFGNVVIKENYKNPLKRGKYTSDKLRLLGRLVFEMRNKSGNNDLSASDALRPSEFMSVLNAVQVVSGIEEDSFHHPSNARKLGQHLKKLAGIKETEAIMSDDNDQQIKQQEARDFLILMEKKWPAEISVRASATIAERNFNKKTELPLPSDLKKVSDYLQNEAGKLDSVDLKDDRNYLRAVEIIQARLLTYNKRRPGELEGTRTLWARERAGKEEHFATYMNELSTLEKQLLQTHDSFSIRGKRGRPVPVLVPLDIKPLFEKLLVHNSECRYLFRSPSDQSKVVLAAESLSKVVESANCEKPDLIKSTLMRKFMSTTCQVMSLKDNEMRWVMDQLGHSFNVDEEYYRMASSTIQRAKVSKLLLLADQGEIDAFKGKALDELDFDQIPVQMEYDECRNQKEQNQQGDRNKQIEKENAVETVENSGEEQLNTQTVKKSGGKHPSSENGKDVQKSKRRKISPIRKSWKRHPSSEHGKKTGKSKQKKISKSNQDPDWMPQNMSTNVPSTATFSKEARESYDTYVAPKVAERVKVLNMKETKAAIENSHVLKQLPYRKIKNKMNADVQRLRRNIVKIK
jgi:hypothetical protein